MLLACVLASAGVGASVVDPFSPRQNGGHGLVVRPFTPTTHAVAYMLWSEAEPLSRLAKAFLGEIRKESALLERTAPHQQDGAKATERRKL